ncbi:hypothetical protein GCM10009634_73460 [Saccharothrix xinjiangensis]
MPSHRYRISLIVVAATGDEVTSTVHDTQAADHHHGVASLRSSNTLAEFLRRHDEFAIPDGIPIVRFDTTDEAVSFAFAPEAPRTWRTYPQASCSAPTAPPCPTTARRGTH